MAGRKRPSKQTRDQLDLELQFEDASLADETQRRYLNYALSVITSRALPDVRDGLKPVQRRILYTMKRQGLRPDAKYRKSATVVGEVMGKLHPHGDTAIYDALVRLAQPFAMKRTLVNGRGNFGSPDGDPPAAMRYTEAKLTALAEELMAELGSDTVDFRPNYDGTQTEPIVLPARFPNLLVNGSYGIAVGMATSIPPHNLGEVLRALIAMIDRPNTRLRGLLSKIKGPDFPTGGELLSTREEIEAVYETGQGSLKLRGEWTLEKLERGATQIVITSVPYAIERRTIVEKIADVIRSRKLPALVLVRDESTDECRIVCDLKKGADPQLVMSYLYKHTPLQSNVQINLTCLVPTDNPEVSAPNRLSLLEVLRHFLDFRMEVVVRRLQHALRVLEERIHILEGFETAFDVLDEVIRIIRRSDGKKDAAQKLIKKFSFSELQVDAILELRLYRLAKLEILQIREELGKKRAEAKRIRGLLRSEPKRWKLIRGEFEELLKTYPDPRRTAVVGEVDEPEYDAEDFIVDEDHMVVLTAQGWVKRQQRVRDVGATRVRDGDEVFEVVAGSTRSALAFFSTHGVCYVCRVVDVQATSGYGVPVQTLFKMKDGERIVGMLGFDPRIFEVPPATEGAEEPEPPHAIAVTKGGMSMRFSLRAHRDPSTRAGRKYMRPRGDDEVIFVGPVYDDDSIACATAAGRALICPAEEVSLLSGAGKGVMLIKLQKGDEVVGAAALGDDSDLLVVENERGRQFEISTRRYGVVSRAGRGFQLFKRGRLKTVVWGEPTLPGFPVAEDE
ncbi:MAG: DNA topoisomerase IV subunit A [Myxococcota bacterium]